MEERVTEPSSSINWEYKPDYIRIKVAVPGVKTVFAGVGKRKLDPQSADVNVNFDNNEAQLDVKIKDGTLQGTIYRVRFTKDDLKDNLVAPEPRSYHKVQNDDEVRLYIRKR